MKIGDLVGQKWDVVLSRTGDTEFIIRSAPTFLQSIGLIFRDRNCALTLFVSLYLSLVCLLSLSLTEMFSLVFYNYFFFVANCTLSAQFHSGFYFYYLALIFHLKKTLSCLSCKRDRARPLFRIFFFNYVCIYRCLGNSVSRLLHVPRSILHRFPIHRLSRRR